MGTGLVAAAVLVAVVFAMCGCRATPYAEYTYLELGPETGHAATVGVSLSPDPFPSEAERVLGRLAEIEGQRLALLAREHTGPADGSRASHGHETTPTADPAPREAACEAAHGHRGEKWTPGPISGPDASERPTGGEDALRVETPWGPLTIGGASGAALVGAIVLWMRRRGQSPKSEG